MKNIHEERILIVHHKTEPLIRALGSRDASTVQELVNDTGSAEPAVRAALARLRADGVVARVSICLPALWVMRPGKIHFGRW